VGVGFSVRQAQDPEPVVGHTGDVVDVEIDDHLFNSLRLLFVLLNLAAALALFAVVTGFGRFHAAIVVARFACLLGPGAATGWFRHGSFFLGFIGLGDRSDKTYNS
jgi:hypothetical protein